MGRAFLLLSALALAGCAGQPRDSEAPPKPQITIQRTARGNAPTAVMFDNADSYLLLHRVGPPGFDCGTSTGADVITINTAPGTHTILAVSPDPPYLWFAAIDTSRAPCTPVVLD